MSPAKTSVRPLTSRERLVAFWVGIALGTRIAADVPLFEGDISELNAHGLVPAFVAYEAAFGALGVFLFWAFTYALRRAATSPRAPRWFSQGMDPGPPQ